MKAARDSAASAPHDSKTVTVTDILLACPLAWDLSCNGATALVQQGVRASLWVTGV